MQSKATTVEAYLAELPEERQQAMNKLRKEIKKNLPKGFSEGMGYGMMGWDVPHSIYPAGYHCNPKLPVPFMGLASQKKFISVYHMGMYGDNDLTKWFIKEYEKLNIGKLDMGKCCIRFKNMEKIPYKLIGELSAKMTPKQWIDVYEKNVMNHRKKK